MTTSGILLLSTLAAALGAFLVVAIRGKRLWVKEEDHVVISMDHPSFRELAQRALF